MLMKIKNKVSLGFVNLINSAAKAGGIPDLIEVTPTEAYDLLRELCNIKDIRNDFEFQQEEGAHDIKLKLFGDLPDADGLNEIANEWYKRTMGITFKEIPIYIVIPPKEVPEKKPRDRRFVRPLSPRAR
jgi:hypothetical protein